ncbi:pentatricopeptide repeat-containing protein At4g30825, chloroplastic [Nymphaea colorata]|uniref:Pentacotripeptide-repeat region of PRORP domain-containing protein n=1 Tax=Nymphaea colorata TaxID=210225 RepID=A0A5K1E9J0_9MAGN|nr:pentatricopeptide repeat-containing protein At4g30825, chloroplastic [Nymphaea colorata]XP_031489325.1 pentatricopeptide repeat-containing protein At4g30825, chloroplastic [Nymphaea colorata]XP_049934304.1 pentatricopeptide repeat-containing protein At4g30825, chloroplastic [Nymphaea colorata]
MASLSLACCLDTYENEKRGYYINLNRRGHRRSFRWCSGNSAPESKLGKVWSIRFYGTRVDSRTEEALYLPSFRFTSTDVFGCVRIIRTDSFHLYSKLERSMLLGASGAHSFGLESDLSNNSEINISDNVARPLDDSLNSRNLSKRRLPGKRGLPESDYKSPLLKRVSKLSKYLQGAKEGKKIETLQHIIGKTNDQTTEQDKHLVSDVGYDLQAMISSIGPQSSLRHCNAVLKVLEQRSENEMLKMFEWMKKNDKLKGNRTAYNLALRVLGRRENWDGAEALLHEMCAESGCILTCQVFNSLIYACYKKGLVDWGTKWFRTMLNKSVQPNQATFGMMMNLYKKSNNIAEAEFAFGQMRSFHLCCCVAYSAMMTIYTRSGLYEKAEEVITFMKEDGVLPNTENWLVRLNTYCQQGKLEEAESVLRAMKQAGAPPNIVAYNTLITGYGKKADIEGAQRVFHAIEKVKLVADETTYRSMVEGCGRAGKYEEALWFYKELKRLGFQPNASNFYTVINLQAKLEDDEGTIQTLKDMRAVGCQHSSIVSSLLQAYERVERLAKVPLILEASFYDALLRDQTSCSILVLAYIKHGMVDEALQVLQGKVWKDHVYEDNLYHLLICSCKEAGCYEHAVKIFMQMPISVGKPNLYITCSMIDVYSSMGHFEKAEDLYFKLRSTNRKLDMVAYSVIVRMYVKAKLFKSACSVLETMDEHKDIMPDAFLFRDMLRIYKQLDMPDKLADIYYRILKSGIVWDEAMYNCVINCCGHALPIDELSRLFDEMLELGIPPNTITFNVMIHIYGKAGFFKKAWKVLRIAQKMGVADAISFNTIIAAYGKNKDFKKMKFAARQMEYAGFEISLEAYNSMLDAYGKEDYVEEFNDVLQKMKESCCVSDHYTYNIMINIYGKKGWIEEVANVLAELKERGLEPDLWSYNTLIKAYGIAGMVEEAVYQVKEMRDRGIEPDRITFINVIDAFQRNDNFLEAVKWSLWMKQLGVASSKH